MASKTCLITGGNSGIGKAAAIQLAKHGVKIIIGCRDEKRGLAALKEIKEKSKSNSAELLLLDMSSQRCIRSAVNELISNHSHIDVLIHNAADFDISRKAPQYSDENIETVWATNHVGPVLLTELLLDKLKQSEQGRIITIASQGLVLHPFLKINYANPEFTNENFRVETAYYQSKLAQVMYTYWLSDKLKNTKITVNCIRVTNVKIDIERYPNLSQLMKFMYSIKSKFSLSPDEMAQTYLYLATSPELQSVTGKYFDEKNRLVTSSKFSKDKHQIEKLMEVTAKYIFTDSKSS
ncbi:SDR family NAD(P)-dependent oxidoreductase [Metabacillus litoralis]|uniref:SDR family NAD(P)-dependent oxidoreductase n=2 Tax=Metabacillus litoralis TaxID=152268 RepID=UPI002041067A|nr:SDR family NAD(P)-dependent oxidoreductase [Metabacillus litoralis]MCM3164893.1 SDR family NAD(P)-dependent oxidoreductase [Metabacillus litoralis]